MSGCAVSEGVMFSTAQMLKTGTAAHPGGWATSYYFFAMVGTARRLVRFGLNNRIPTWRDCIHHTQLNVGW